MVPDVSAGPDATVQFYLRAQAMLNIGFGLFLGLGCSIPILFAVGKPKMRNIPWLVLGLAVMLFCLYFAYRELRVPAPRLSLSGDLLRAGDRELRLDDSTEIVHLGDEAELALPPAERKGFRAMPGGHDFPPRFLGGPRVQVRTRAGELSFQPLLYGPGAYLPVGQAAAAELVQRLCSFGEGGNARDWLRSAFPAVSGEPAPPESRKFTITFLFIAVPVLTFLLITVAIGLRKKLFP